METSGYGLPTYSVNTATLNLVAEDTDFSYAGRGPGIAFTRTWNADPSWPGMFGNGWGFSYESTLAKHCNGAFLKKGSGQGILYAADLCPASGSLTYPLSATPPAGNFNKLSFMQGDYWLLEEKETRLTYRYDLQPGGTDAYRLTSITDRNGNAVLISYNEDGTISSVADAAGRATAFAYDAHKRCTSMTVPDGRRATYNYDASGNMTGNTDLLGTAIAYTYDAENYMASMAYAGKTIQFTYDTTGGWKHIATVVDANGNTKSYTALSGTSTRVTDALGGVTSYTSESGRTSGVFDPLQHITYQTYSNGLPVTSVDANGNTAATEYDGGGNITKYTDPLGNVTTYAYDAESNLTSKTDALGKIWAYQYDGSRNLLKSLSPLNGEIAYAYDAKGQLTNLTDPNGNLTSFTYDGFGNLETITDANGKITTMGYGPSGFNRISETDPLGRITRFAYDNNGRLIKTTYPDNSTKTFLYDACAMTSMTDENGKTRVFERNPLLYITRVTDPLGNSTLYNYDANNNATAVTDALGKVTAMTYDAAGRQRETQNHSGGIMQRVFDAKGNLLLLNDEKVRGTSFTYDANDQMLSLEDPLTKKTTFTWDALGRITSKNNPDGSSISYAYDADGRVTGKTFSGSASISYTYDAAGNLLTVDDATGKTIYTYDNLNRVASIGYPDGLALAFAYDEVGNISSLTYPGGAVVSYTYDNRNRIATAAWETGNFLHYTYDAAGNIKSIRRSNGTESVYAYDGDNRIMDIGHRKGSVTFAAMNYRRNAMGNTIEETLTLPVSHNLTEALLSATYNDVNQITAWNSDAYAYDANGNLINVGGSSSFSAAYDAENRPVSLSQGGITNTYSYDGLGMRTKVLSGAQRRNFHHDASGRLMVETDGNGVVKAYYIYSGKFLSAMAIPSGEMYFYHFDKTGNAMALTDRDGNIASAYAYEPFGKVSNKTGTVANPFTYAGAMGVMDEGDGLGLYFMRNRHYDSRTGKFLQKDPLGFAGGINLYRYVGNNAINRIDPFGFIFDNADPYNNAMMKDPKGRNQLAATIVDWSSWAADWALWTADKSMNFASERVGLMYTFGKMLWNAETSQDAGYALYKTTAEGAKGLLGMFCGPQEMLALDLAQDVTEKAVETGYEMYKKGQPPPPALRNTAKIMRENKFGRF